MKRVHTTKRANAVDLNDIRTHDKYKTELEHQGDRTREGRVRRLTTRDCPCGVKHYGYRSSLGTNKQDEVNKLCNKCFEEKYEKRRPPNVSMCFRDLNKTDLLHLENKYKAQGFKVYKVDPSTL